VLAGDTGCPNAVCLFECSGPVEEAALRRALESIVSRHEILRTVFRKQRELILPMQVILEEVAPLLDVVDLTALSDEEQRLEIEFRFRHATQETNAATDPPVLSCSLFRLSGDKHSLLVTLPALCADAASFRVLAEELNRALSGVSSTDDLIQYADVTAWQHDLLTASEDAAVAARAFWQTQKHVPVLLPMETDDTKQGVAAETVNIPVSPANVETLKEMALSKDLTTADVLLAVWFLLLNRMTAESRPVVLVSSDGREYEEIENAIGIFARYLPIAADFDGKAGFNGLLAAVATQWKQARAQQDWFNPGSASTKPTIGFEYNELRPRADQQGSPFTVSAVHPPLRRCWPRLCSTRLNRSAAFLSYLKLRALDFWRWAPVRACLSRRSKCTS
jgi:hypothetical protein